MARATIGITAKGGGLSLPGPSSGRRWAAVGPGYVADGNYDRVRVIRSIDDARKLSESSDVDDVSPLTQMLETAVSLSGTVVYAVAVEKSKCSALNTSLPTSWADWADADWTVEAPATVNYGEHTLEIVCTKAGAPAAATWDVWLDGIRKSKDTLIGASAWENYGFKLTLSGTAYKVGQRGTLVCHGYAVTAVGDITGAVDDLTASTYDDWSWCAVVGPITVVASQTSVRKRIADPASTSGGGQPDGRYPLAMIEVGLSAQTDTQMGTALTKSTREDSGWLLACGGYSRQVTAEGGVAYRRMLGIVAGRAAATPTWRGVDDTGLGPIDLVVDLGDRSQTPSAVNTADDNGFCVLCRYPGRRGVYILHGRMAVDDVGPGGDDFQYLERARVIRLACRAVYDGQFPFLNSNPLVAADGSLTGIETFRRASSRRLWDMRRRNAIVDYAVDIQTTNFLSDEEVITNVAIIPRGKMTRLTGTVRYRNPLFDAQAAAAVA